MNTYVIGDIQGCFDELMLLLEKVHFKEGVDRLFLVGDLVNRGPKSLEVLRFVSALANVTCVLGNHDLALLAQGYANIPIHDHTLDAVLEAPDREKLLSFLRHLPLLYQEANSPYVLVHAGIFPKWTIDQAHTLASEVETLLQGPNFQDFLAHMFGDTPVAWDETLDGYERARFITNAFTRMRFCTEEGALDLSYHGTLASAPSHLHPWFTLRQAAEPYHILFGHWAALQGKGLFPHFIPLDTGCVWGRSLTALRLEDLQFFQVACTAPTSRP